MNSSYLGFERLGHNPNFEIALNMTLDQLRFYCTSNKQFRTICMDQEFWLEKFRREFPEIIQYKPENMTWAQYYSDITPLMYTIINTHGLLQNMTAYDTAQEVKRGNRKIVFVGYNGRIVGGIFMVTTDTLIGVNQKAINLLLLMNVQFDLDHTKYEDMKLATRNNTWKEVIIEYGLISEVLTGIAPNESVHYNYLPDPDGPLTFWDDLG